MIVVGHRGARGHAPENTLPGIERGLELGADWIEFDVHLVEGRFLVIHDERLERTTNGRGPLADHTLAAIRRLDAGDGACVPFLEEVLDLLAGRAVANIELKASAAAGTLATQVAAWLAQRGADPRSVVISCFDHAALETIHGLLPAIRIGALLKRVQAAGSGCSPRLGAWSVHPPAEAVHPAFVAAAHRQGLRVLPFTVNDEEPYRRLAAMGVDGVFSDYPDRIAAWRGVPSG